jgi:hypothetical protein
LNSVVDDREREAMIGVENATHANLPRHRSRCSVSASSTVGRKVSADHLPAASAT